jgi:hypothetical protein
MASTQDMIAFSERMLTDRALGRPTETEVQSIEETVERPDEGFIQKDDGLKNVEVPNDYINQILGFNDLLEAAKPVPKPVQAKATMKPEVVQDLTEAERLQEKISSLVERLTMLLKEAREVMSEMTSTGSIGVGPQKSLGLKRSGNEYPPKARKQPLKSKRA